MRSGACTTVFCETLASEWVRHHDKKRPDDYAKLLDRCDCVHEFDPMPGVPLAECLNECGRLDTSLGLSEFKILRPLAAIKPLLVFLSTHHPDCPRCVADLEETQPSGTLPEATVLQTVQSYQSLLEANAKLWSIGVDGDRTAFETTKTTQANISVSTIGKETTIKYWVASALGLEQILNSVSPETNAKELIASIDLTRCPGTCLYFRAYDKYVRSKTNYDEPSDLVDQSYLPGLAYCDYALVDKRIRNFIEQAQREGAAPNLTAMSNMRDFATALQRRLGEGMH